MKFFNWMQSKFSAGQGVKKANSVPATNHREKEQEEFSDWPHGLLAIGTFGYAEHTSKQQLIHVDQTSETGIPQENDCSSPDFEEFTAEEVWSLHKELSKLLRRKPAIKTRGAATADLPLDRFLNCPSSLEVDLTVSGRLSTDSDDKDEEDIDRTIRIFLGRCKDVCQKKKKKKAVGRSSLSFLVKKMFVCRSGFLATPGVGDTLQESRMEKLLRAMLTKKICPRNSSRASSTKKCLEDYRHIHNAENEEERNQKSRDGSKWDRTDSEFIVLEI